MSTPAIPVLVFTGFLGAGKTTIILNLIKQLSSVKCAWLKNEFGNVEVDSQLAKENAISTKEILNGCLCCTLTGRLGDAMQEIMAEYKPQLLIVETSGSAFPAPIAWEIRRLQAEGVLNVSLDALINVIDIANFRGYEDKSYTAKVQAKYTDLILINKHELLTEQQYDDAMDDVFELNPDTPKVKTDRGFVPSQLMLGLHTTLFSDVHHHSDAEEHDTHHHQKEVDVYTLQISSQDRTFDIEQFKSCVQHLSNDSYYRIKGIVNFGDGFHLVNMAFGRFEAPLPLKQYEGNLTRLSFVGVGISVQEIAAGLSVDAACISKVE